MWSREMTWLGCGCWIEELRQGEEAILEAPAVSRERGDEAWVQEEARGWKKREEERKSRRRDSEDSSSHEVGIEGQRRGATGRGAPCSIPPGLPTLTPAAHPHPGSSLAPASVEPLPATSMTLSKMHLGFCWPHHHHLSVVDKTSCHLARLTSPAFSPTSAPVKQQLPGSTPAQLFPPRV